MKTPIRNQSGLSLVQVLVTIAIMSVTVLAIAEMTVNAFRSVRSISQSSEAENIRQAMQLTLSSPQMCLQAFSAANLPATWTGTIDLPSITYGAVTLAKKDTDVNGIKANAIQLIYQAG